VTASGIRFIRQLALPAICLLALTAEAQTRYVSDEVVITFRRGPGSEFAIIRNLTSGDSVEVLEELDDDEGYARVRLPDGTEGWVLTRYLQDEPTAALRLETATRELTRSNRDAAGLEAEVARLSGELEQTQAALDAALGRADGLQTELRDVRSASASALETRNRNESLSLEVAGLTEEVRNAEAQISQLQSRNRQSWFVIGAAVLFGGIVIGLVAPSLRRSRRSSW
jgi:SH3 domain protein